MKVKKKSNIQIQRISPLNFEEVRNSSNIVNEHFNPRFETIPIMPSNIIWRGPITDAGGYAGMNRENILGLIDRGFKVRIDSMDTIIDIDPIQHQFFKDLQIIPIRDLKNCIKVFGSTALREYNHPGYKVLYTMMETKSLHKDYVKYCNNVDEIWVPSKWCKKVFIESGVNVPIKYMPLGIDLDIYNKNICPLPQIKQITKGFTFLSVFGWSERKGISMLRAYLEAFTSKDDVTLLISTRYAGSVHEAQKDVVRKYFMEELIPRCKNKDLPHVLLFMDIMPEHLMPGLYRSCDAFFLISKGEGFGRPYMEAGATNIPIIGSNYSGHTDFLNWWNSYLVNPSGFKIQEEMNWITDFYHDQEFPYFDEKKIDECVDLLRYVYRNYHKAKRKANRLQKRIQKHFQLKNCIDQVGKRLLEIEDI